CWHETHDDVSVEQVLAYLAKNAETAQKILRNAIVPAANRKRDCACPNALQYAIITNPAAIPAKVKHDLAPIIGKYMQ
ncbi:MAG: S-methyl-5'-thioadenosine phosphorylase, partial [Acidobacteriota bacterium]|nr:S-methyl-5'-thioadenosine phosphorylase [Acidobacteriota bacterium]